MTWRRLAAAHYVRLCIQDTSRRVQHYCELACRQNKQTYGPSRGSRVFIRIVEPWIQRSENLKVTDFNGPPPLSLKGYRVACEGLLTYIQSARCLTKYRWQHLIIVSPHHAPQACISLTDDCLVARCFGEREGDGLRARLSPTSRDRRVGRPSSVLCRALRISLSHSHPSHPSLIIALIFAINARLRV